MIELGPHGRSASLCSGDVLPASVAGVRRSGAALRASLRASLGAGARDLDEDAGFFRGLVIGLALTVPFWAVVIWGVGRLLGA